MLRTELLGRENLTDIALDSTGLSETFTHTSIRVMPGKSHSPFPYQQQPYVIYTKNGKVTDRLGNVLDDSSLPQAHIPLQDFVFRE